MHDRYDLLKAWQGIDSFAARAMELDRELIPCGAQCQKRKEVSDLSVPPRYQFRGPDFLQCPQDAIIRKWMNYVEDNQGAWTFWRPVDYFLDFGQPAEAGRRLIVCLCSPGPSVLFAWTTKSAPCQFPRAFCDVASQKFPRVFQVNAPQCIIG